ncbi:SRPBCC family protein [Undibacterium sp. TC4M20W]|uniref:SRPBCC family protein n=1 Tax=Undibacterium sp. TC4M20W TaxID=3413052 RepID=UPI003BF31DE8
MTPRFRVLTASALLCLATPALAEVINISSNGFQIRHEVLLNIPPEEAYELLVNVSNWWSPSHTYTHNTKNLSIDARPGGCFCEKYPNGGGVQHLSVVHAAPGKALRMSGALGPLQAHGLAGSMSWDFIPQKPAEKSQTLSKLVLTYSVGGYMLGGFEKIAPMADNMLGEQITRYKNFANTGKVD